MIITAIKKYISTHSIAGFLQTAVVCISLLVSSFATSQSIPTPILSGFGSKIQSDPHFVIRTLTEQHGPYDSRLGESLRAIGRSLQESSEHEIALEYLEQAWQVAKVNTGIYSAEQINTLELIIYSEMEKANWDAVNDHYTYLELLYRRVYSPSDSQLELGLQKVSAWHVNALMLRDRSEQKKHLRKAYHLFKDRLKMAELNLEPTDPKFAYLKESIKITQQQLRLKTQRNNSVLWQPSIAGSSLAANSY